MFKGHYIGWRKKRTQAILDHYGASFFAGKHLLELGCGYADIGATFHELGAIVTCVEARPEHIAVAKTRYPFLTVIRHDLDGAWNLGSFDVIIHFGLLYHLFDIEAHLKAVCSNCQHLVLESIVCDSSQPVCTHEPESGYDQAFNGIGSRPSASYIERLLSRERMLYQCVIGPACNHDFHQYDWQYQDTGITVFGQRRIWFCRHKITKTAFH